MKLLAFVDNHGDLSSLRKIKKKAKQAELLICAGDISLFEQDLDFLLYELNKIGKPLLIIPGNHETETNLKNICALFENVYYIHKKLHKFKDYLIIGYGTGGFSLTEPEFNKFMAKNKAKLKSKKIILVIHAPPYHTNLDKLNSDYYGNKTFRDFVEKKKPKLVICGHFHENSGKSQKIGKTLVINPGPDGKILEV